MDDTERKIDSLLIYMNDQCEEHGARVSCILFDFRKLGDDPEVQYFLSANQFSIEDFQKAIRVSNTRGFIEHATLGCGEFGSLRLTTKGQARAISAKNGKTRPQEPASSVNIGAVHMHGDNNQIGNGNTINVQQNLYEEILNIIESSTACKKEKDEAKSLLVKFFENPSVAAVLGSVTGAFTKIFQAG